MEITPKDSVNIEAYVNQVQDKDKVEATPEKAEKQQAKTDTVVLSDAAKRIQEAERRRVEEEFGLARSSPVHPEKLRKTLNNVRDELQDIVTALGTGREKKP